jgi:predicted AlkP superfamily phosphohydrolase/phosphomutase
VTRPAVLIIGLDGATWRLYEPWARAGRLPNLAALMARGSWGRLRSTVPALTMPAWSSFMTGVNPGAHGVFAFKRFARDRYGSGGLANATDLRAPTLWDIAGAAGRRVGVMNVPPSYPLRPVNGFVVSCMLTPPGERFTYPPELQAELDGYMIDLKAPRDLRPESSDYPARALTYVQGLAEQTRRRTEAAAGLLARHPVDLFCVVFYAPDRLQHYFWDRLDRDREQGGGPDTDLDAALAEAYAAVDAAVGRLVEAAGPDATVIVVSDHGFIPSPTRAVHLNRWLADEGLLTQRPWWTLRRKVVRKILPDRWRARYDTVDHILVNRARTKAWSDAIFTDTAAIWINVAGRFPLGCVAPGAEYEAVRDRVRHGLAALRDDSGRQVIRAVHRREDVYRGPFVDEAPDLIAVCEPGFGVVYEGLRRDLRARSLFGPFREEGYTGTHDADGLYVFAGPAVAPLGEHREYPIESIAPTALHLLGVPVPQHMEGPACTSVLREDFLRAHPIRYTEAVAEVRNAPTGWRSEDDEARIADHLRALGYLE